VAQTRRHVPTEIFASREEMEQVTRARGAEIRERDPRDLLGQAHQRGRHRRPRSGQHRGAAVGGELTLPRKEPADRQWHGSDRKPRQKGHGEAPSAIAEPFPQVLARPYHHRRGTRDQRHHHCVTVGKVAEFVGEHGLQFGVGCVVDQATRDVHRGPRNGRTEAQLRGAVLPSTITSGGFMSAARSSRFA
jgi:hypothetical protein